MLLPPVSFGHPMTGIKTAVKNILLLLPITVQKQLFLIMDPGLPPQDLNVLLNNGILVTLNKGEKAQTLFGGQLVKFIVVAPQASSYTIDTTWLNPNINDLTKRLLVGVGGVVKMDSTRIYITSYSAGGKPAIGNTCLTSSDSIYSRLIAASVPMSPATQDVNFSKLYLGAVRNIHFLSFTGALDPSYIPQMIRVQDTIQKHDNTLFPIADIMPGNAHCCWEQYWDTAFSIPGFGKNIYQWLLLWQRGSSNSPPTLNAGANQNLLLPINSAVLTGVATQGSSKIISTAWNQLSGPSVASVICPSCLFTTVSNLVRGTYIFQLTATDSLGLTSFSATQIVVQAPVPPLVSAGGNPTVIFPSTSVTLLGSATKGTGGPVTSTLWSQRTGPTTASIVSPNFLTTQINGLISGTYVFRLTASDSVGSSSFDSSVVTVYAANGYTINVRLYAGVNPFHNSVWNNWNEGTGIVNNKSSGLLKYSDGTNSPIAAILSYQDNLADNGTNYVSGATICPDTVLRYTSYTTSTRTLTITGLNNSSKYNLEFYASRSRTDGQKTIFTIGTQSISVLTDNNSSNAAKFSTITPSGGQIVVTLNRGSVYNYLNGFKITANIVNTPPTSNAGPNQTIRLPLNSATLSGTVTPGSSNVISTNWSQSSGPNTSTIGSPASLNTLVNNLVQGVYVFKLTATDSLGASSFSSVQVTVSSQPVPPIVNAGNNQTIAQPASSVTLKGTDTARSSPIISIIWSQVSGPGTSTISAPGSLNTLASNLVLGIYLFKLTAIDSLGLSSSSTVQVTVLPPSVPPSVNAGPNQTITLPVNTIILSGVDTAGTSPVVSTKWSLLIGPNSDSILTPGMLQTSVTNLIQGIYQFQLSATDSMGLITSSTIQVVVKPPLGFVYKHIVVIGSSTANGYLGSPPLWPHDSCWERQLFHYYQSRLIVDTSINLAVISTNCYNGMPSWFIPFDTLSPTTYSVDSLHNITEAISDKPSAILVGYPTNNYDFLTIPQVMFALRTIKTSGDSAGIPTLILGTQPRGNLSPSEHQKLIDINDSIRAEFGARAILYYDSVASSPRSFNMNPNLWLNGDSIHMNPTGHDIILRQILRANIFTLPAVVSAGADQTITLPLNSITLKGAVNPGSSKIISTNWRLLSGPPSDSILSPGSLQTAVMKLIQGIYAFQLSATDSLGIITSSIVHVTVKSPIPPIVNAGTDQTISFPVNSILLHGVDTAGSSRILSTTWSLVSGPNSDSILSPQSLSTPILKLIPGNYTFQLSALDSAGLTASSLTHIVVKPPAPPIVNAGIDQTISFPVNSIILHGVDTAGGSIIVSTSWSLLSGPNSDSILSPGLLTTTVINLIPGTYIFKLSVTDSLGLITSSMVNVIVKPPAPPIVNAGVDQSIIFPSSSVILSGVDTAGSYKIISTTWSLISGPNGDSILSPGSLITTVSNLAQGAYIFQLSATDSMGLATNSQTHVFVKAPLPPSAKAGGNQVITLPVSSITLSGIATAGSSVLVSTTWSQSAGPGAAILNTPGSLTTLISNLIQGVYVFRFTVIDSLGNRNSDSATVTVNSQPPSTINVRLYAGLVPFRNNQWNNWNVGAAPQTNISSGVLSYSDGTPSAVSTILSYEDNLADNGSAYTSGATMCPDTVLRFSSYTTSTRYLTINGLKNLSKYNLEFYASRSRTDGQKTVFTIGSQGITILTDKNSSNAAKFSNLSPSSGHIMVTITRTSIYNYLNGFKITEINGATSSNDILDPLLTGRANSEIKTFNIELYPNPVADFLFISNTGNNPVQVQIFDISGRQLAIYRHISYSYEINMHPLARGTYILIATDERTREIFRKTIIKY